MKTLKHLVSCLLLLAGLLCFGLPALAAEIDYGYVSKTGTGSSTADVVFPHKTSKTLRLLSLDVSTDLTNCAVKFYGGTTTYTASAASLSTATNIVVLANTSCASNDVVVVQASDGSTFTATVWGTSGTTNIYMTGQLGTAVASGATVHRMSKVHTIHPASTNEFRLSGEAIFAPQLRQPLLVRATGTSAVTINNATVHYDASEE